MCEDEADFDKDGGYHATPVHPKETEYRLWSSSACRRTLEEVSRPVKSERDIDRDILRNLRTLRNGASDREIVQSLLSDEPVGVDCLPCWVMEPRKTWEKAFYFLLLRYRNKHLENFNPEPEQ